MKALLRTIFFLAASIVCTQQAKAQVTDPSFPLTDIYQPATVRAALRQADGKYVVIGDFLKVNGTALSGLARLNADGSLDQTFAATSTVQTAPTGLRQLPSGRILLSSSGTLTVSGQSFRNLVQLNADGTLGPALATGTGASGGIAKVVTVQPDGKILIAGAFTSFNGVASNRFVRLNADGSVDTQFSINLGSGFTGEVATMLLQPDGKIVVGGRFQDFNGTGRRMLVRLNADGTHDSSFAATLNGPSYSYVGHLGLDPRTNNLVVQGINLQNRAGAFRGLLRLTPTGDEDPLFAPASSGVNFYNGDYNGNDQLAVDSQGRIVFGGHFEYYYNSPTRVNSSLVRLLPNGAVDTQFAPGPALLGKINNVLLQPDGQVLIVGNLRSAFGSMGASVIRLDSNAQLDPTFQTQMLGAGYVAKMLRQADGKLLVAGRFTDINGQPASNIARFNADGTRDAAFLSTGPDYLIRTLAIQPDGRILIGGLFTTVAGNSAPLLARLHPNGGYDASFTMSFPDLISSSVWDIAVQSDGNVLVGGSGLTLPGTSVTALHRLLPNGQLDQTYETNLNTSFSQVQVLSLALLPDGRLYVGGVFSASNSPGFTSPALVRLNNDGTPDPTFTLSTSSTQTAIHTLLPLASGQVLAAGRFSDYNGAARVNIVRLNANGIVDTGFNANLSFSNSAGIDINFIVPQPNGRLLIGSGIPTRVNNVSQGTFLRLLPDGALDNTFAAGPSLINGSVYSAVVHPTGSILVSGQFTQAAGQQRISMAHLTAPHVLFVAPRSVTQTTKIWPVPARASLHLQVNLAAQPGAIYLVDMQGRCLISQKKPVQAESTLDTRHLSAGVYMLRVEYADGPVTRRIMIE